MLKPGTTIGNYIIEDILAEGGMARVYRAKHYLLNSKHAIKAVSYTHLTLPTICSV